MPADKPGMTFHIAAAYGVTILTGLVLGWMAVQNQRSGWRRERSNVILDTLIAWAKVKQEMSRNAQSLAPSPAPAAMTNQLFALSAALGQNTGIAPPAKVPQQSDEIQPVPVEAERV
jgi:hypothetical protein